MSSFVFLGFCRGGFGSWSCKCVQRPTLNQLATKQTPRFSVRALNDQAQDRDDGPLARNSLSSLRKNAQDKGSVVPDRLLDSLDLFPLSTRRKLEQQYDEIKHLEFFRGLASRAYKEQQHIYHAVKEWQGRVLYSYFNWREDTWSDVQLLLWLNGFILLLGAAIQGSVVQKLDPTVLQTPPGTSPLQSLWTDMYEVMVVVLGQDLPDVASGLPGQLFAVAAAVVGLASFALVLALIEQVVLEVLDSNVRQGSRVYEEGHMVVLTWCDSARDLSMVKKVLSQICQANRGKRGGTAVVLAQDREKLDMERIFREAIPPSARHGTQFVFRQGCPLDPGALHMVGVTKARAVIVCGDHARSAKESDAQCLRAAILLDELADEESKRAPTATVPGGPRVVVHARSPDAEKALRFSCSARVIPVPTAISIAKRISRIVRHPVTAAYSHMLTDFSSTAHGVINGYPELEGLPFKDLHSRFPYATVMGIMNDSSGKCILNPNPDQVIEPGDEVMMLRPGPFEPETYPPILHPPAVSLGRWSPGQYTLEVNVAKPSGQPAATAAASSNQESTCSPDRPPKGSAVLTIGVNQRLEVKPSNVYQSEDRNGIISQQSAMGNSCLYTLPLQYSSTLMEPTDVLVCGWSSDCLMWAFLEEVDHGTQPLPQGSRVTLLNAHSHVASHLGDLCHQHSLHRLEVKHVLADPRVRHSLASAIDISQYQAAVVLSDHSWCEGSIHDMQEHRSISQSEMLRLDSEVLQVQINIRLLLQERGCPNINIICERTSYTGRTRFEDPTHLPLSIIINSASYSAKILTQVAYEPRLMRPYSQLGLGSDIVVQDSSALVKKGEKLSYVQLQARVASVHQVLMGYYQLPAASGFPLEIVVNPLGLEERMKPLIWNRGDFRCKLVTLATTTAIQQASGGASQLTASTDCLESPPSSESCILKEGLKSILKNPIPESVALEGAGIASAQLRRSNKGKKAMGEMQSKGKQASSEWLP